MHLAFLGADSVSQLMIVASQFINKTNKSIRPDKIVKTESRKIPGNRQASILPTRGRERKSCSAELRFYIKLSVHHSVVQNIPFIPL